jgi:hypothetical protein
MTNGTSESGGGQGGIYAILVIIVILIIAAFLYFTGVVGGRSNEPDLEIDIDMPAAPTTGN